MSLPTNRTYTAFAACAILALGVLVGLQFEWISDAGWYPNLHKHTYCQRRK